MTIKDLKELIKDLDDNMTVLLAPGLKFDGSFYQPCLKESGVERLPDEYLEKEEYEERELLGNPVKETEYFFLLPYKFHEPEEEDFKLN